MKTKFFLNFILIFLLSSNIFSHKLNAYGSVEECDRELNEISKKTENTKKEIQSTYDESEILRIQIQEHNRDINNFNLQIKTLEENIVSINKEIEEKQKISNDKQEIILKQLKLQQRATNNNIFLNLLVSSDSLSSFTTTYNVLQKIALEEKKELEEISQIKNRLIELNNEQIIKTQQISNTKAEIEKMANDKIQKKEKLSKILIQQEEDLQKYAADEKDIARQREILLTPPPVNIENNDNSNWRLPVDSGAVITARFMSPTYEQEFGVKHRGTDIALYKGAPIYSIANGHVLKACRWGSFGNLIAIKHKVDDQDYVSLYAHLAAMYVKEGDYVMAGSVIGSMGGTGYCDNSYPVHLHIELSKRDFFTTAYNRRNKHHDNYEVLDFIPWKGSYFENSDAW